MNNTKGLKFSRDHEWVRVEAGKAYIGITDYAQLSLGDIVFVELPQKGKALAAGDAIGVVESVKAASDVYSPVAGTITDVNEELADSPEKINREPYESWLIAVELNSPAELEGLMDEEEYGKFCIKGA
jgi:glycine cleavage system H protein